eukprot:3451973-Alexandrium_andersonii.AAC.1
MLGQPRVDSPMGLPECDSEAVRTLGLLKPLQFPGSWRARMREPLTKPGLESLEMGFFKVSRMCWPLVLKGVLVSSWSLVPRGMLMSNWRSSRICLLYTSPSPRD